MKAWIIFYKLNELEPKIRTKLVDCLFGKIQKSNYGSYEYEIKAIVSKGKCIRPVKSVVIIEKKYLEEVTKLLKLYKVRYKVLEVILEKKEFNKKPFL